MTPTRPSSKACVLLAAILLLCSCPRSGNQQDSKEARAIVLVTVDGLIPSELSVFGGTQPTPNLQAIADAGAAWQDAWTTCPLTRPAVATYLTGLTPERHGVRDDLLASLPEDVPTLATLLRERSYRTAAFLDSSFLGEDSGLHRGFDLVDAQDVIPGRPITWIPFIRPAQQLSANFESWVKELPPDARYFAWIHFSHPLLTQVFEEERQARQKEDTSKDEQKNSTPPTGVERLDKALGSILAALEARGELRWAAIVVAGTMGKIDEDEAPTGPGLAPTEDAMRIPILARFPQDSPATQTGGEPRWAPDVAVSLAKQGGVVLPNAEGVDLLDRPGSDRALHASSWAPRDQMGWTPWRAARAGPTLHIDAPLGPSAPGVPQERVRQVLESRGLQLTPVAELGRVLPSDKRLGAAREVWQGRRMMQQQRVEQALDAYRRALALDPENLAALLGSGQFGAMRRDASAIATLGRAVELYPEHPEVLHWYAHAIWSQSVRDAELLLEAILPFRPHDGDLLYDLACARSLAQDPAAAERYLRSAIEAGFREWELMASDPDLRNLRESGRLAEVLREYRK